MELRVDDNPGYHRRVSRIMASRCSLGTVSFVYLRLVWGGFCNPIQLLFVNSQGNLREQYNLFT